MGFKILIVEDDLDSRIALSLLLELEGFKVVTAEDGETGLELAKKHYPDLIITDIWMPGMSGIELTSYLRANPVFFDLPIIAVTAAAEQFRQEILDTGATACFS